MIKKFLIAVILLILVSFYLFPVSFYFLPETVNTKMILAGFGILAFIYDGMVRQTIAIPRAVLYSALLAIAFSLWCFYCVISNATDDMSYARYWISFFTWLLGAYAICFVMRQLTGSYTLYKITLYLAGVCLLQCILAEVIDMNPGFQRVVDRIFVQDQEFYHEVDRLYGIGAALDTAGVRFSAVLVLMAHQMSSAGKVMESSLLSLFYFVSFIVIVIIGSIIARTTWVGAGMGLGYMLLSYIRIDKGYISSRQLRFWSLFIGLTLLTVVISVILYRTSLEFRNNFRFAFEGFFNWVETGVFRTDSTDKLNSIMWVWPKDTRAWIIGTGLFDNWVYGTDIGYCRFTLYCGLVGMTLFSLFFIFNGIAINYQLEHVALLSIFLIALTFVIWLKVATDIYFIYALITCLGSGKQEEPFLSE